MTFKESLRKVLRDNLFVLSASGVKNPIIITDSRMNKYLDDNIEEITLKMLDAWGVKDRFDDTCAFVKLYDDRDLFNNEDDAVEVGYYNAIEIDRCCDRSAIIPMSEGYNGELSAATFIPDYEGQYISWGITHCPFCGKGITYKGVRHPVYADKKILEKYGDVHKYK